MAGAKKRAAADAVPEDITAGHTRVLRAAIAADPRPFVSLLAGWSLVVRGLVEMSDDPTKLSLLTEFDRSAALARESLSEAIAEAQEQARARAN